MKSEHLSNSRTHSTDRELGGVCRNVGGIATNAGVASVGIRMVPKCPTLPAKWAAPIELSSDRPIRSDALPLASPAEVAPFSILTEAPASGSE